YELDVLLEGQATTFNRTWQDPPLPSSRATKSGLLVRGLSLCLTLMWLWRSGRC
ncbi:unnamed protein product, partial [Symbiodinium pilosum]